MTILEVVFVLTWGQKSVFFLVVYGRILRRLLEHGFAEEGRVGGVRESCEKEKGTRRGKGMVESGSWRSI